MTSKLVEIRDKGTFIPALAVRLDSDNEQERWLLAKAGYGLAPEDQARYVILAQINGGGGRCACDPYEWGQNPRTYHIAHKWIIANFDTMPNGAVVCVEHILGERASPKTSDRFCSWE